MLSCKSLVAHYEDETRKQPLIDHLFQVSEIAMETGSRIGMKNMCSLIGFMHDIGKSSKQFQDYIKKEYNGNVNHSSAGAIMLGVIEDKVTREYNIGHLLKVEGLKERVWQLYKEILQYPILAHHGLYDIIDNNFNYRTGIRLNYSQNYGNGVTSEILGFFDFANKEYERVNGKSLYHIYYEGFIEFIDIYKRIKVLASESGVGIHKEGKKHKKRALYFYYGALVRLLLSILKDADIYNSANYYREHKDKVYSQDDLSLIWEDMGCAIEKLYDRFNSNPEKSKLDITRTILANRIYEFSKNHNKGVYKLSMPVGSGKTYAAFRYAISNAKNFKRSRIFYCTAFLSVLEQNADSIKQVLGDQHILEHHSNVVEYFEDYGDNEDQKEYQGSEYIKESWESPVILTTIVQLSNTLFKDRSSNIRRFAKLIDSVIIIDEVQSLPSKAIYNFNLMTNFLVHIMNCNILHCTATQPNFDNQNTLQYPCLYGDESKESFLIDSIDNPEVFDRVEYYSLLGEDFNVVLNTKDIIDHIKAQLKHEMSALVVLNTKRAVSNLYNGLKNDREIQDWGWEIVYLTTNQCPKHRLEIIQDMKERLAELRKGNHQKKLICVSTKLVEAGVDIDFDLVYRSLAGIDSIIQCGGRCNREGKKISKGRLYILEYEDENLSYLPDLQKQRIAAKAALRMLKREDIAGNKVNIEKACDYYFEKLYANENAAGRYLEFPINNEDTILNLMTTNPNGINNYQIKTGNKPNFILSQSFKTAATNFDLIKEDAISVIVQYNNDELIEQLYNAIECNNYYEIKTNLKKLQPYTVQIRRVNEYENYISKEMEGQILILSREAYDQNIGLTKGDLELLVY